MTRLLVKDAKDGTGVQRIACTGEVFRGTIVGKMYRRLGHACVSVAWEHEDNLALALVKHLERVS